MWEKALRVKADIIEAGVTPNVVTWTSIIEACATAGLVERVFQEFDEMLSAGCCPNVDCYNALLQACVMVMPFTFYLVSLSEIRLLKDSLNIWFWFFVGLLRLAKMSGHFSFFKNGSKRGKYVPSPII